ncbi:adenosylmethionine decarboxylase [Pseudonocardia sp. GCM10023141]|uniref:adenosylmethionine decarboxylase n=1 Tax=Pseudonocardia sp. GCM10023141 TaxID=3252653 RepID=UPI0036224020
MPLADPLPVGSFAGQHVLAELTGVDPALLDDEPRLRDTLVAALEQAGATVLEVSSRQFDPQGVTVIALLSESHASLHTYPECGSAFVDVFTCGQRAEPELAVRLLAAALHAPDVHTRTVHRGKELS